MLFSKNPPEISYLGLPSEFSNKKINIGSYLDLISCVASTCTYNLSLDIKIVCLDVSEFNFSPKFFEDVIEEESPAISKIIDETNSLISKNDIRICFYIGKDYFIGSQLEESYINAIRLIRSISSVLDVLGINYPSLMLRIGSAYGNRKTTMEDFCKKISSLEPRIISRICVMNDDKPSLFSVTDLLSGVYYKCNVPIGFRVLPHQFNDGGLSIREALFLSCSTWNRLKKPLVFYSESCEIDLNGISLSPKSAGILTRRIPTFGLDLDVVIISSSKEDACLKYRIDYKSLPPVVINKISSK